MKIRLSLFFTLFFLLFSASAFAAPDQYVYDRAGILREDEIEHLEKLARELSADREIAFIILTTDDTGGQYIRDYLSFFVDNNRVGYESSVGSTAIIGIDLFNRDVYIEGFGKAETYVDEERIYKIIEKVTPYLSNGDYEQAFETFLKQAHYYSGFKPGFNPDSIFHKLWFQLIIALSVSGIVVGIMVSSRGGKVTVDNNTYIDSDHSGVTSSKDRYVTTTISKVRKPQNDSGGGGGGGFSGGGFSGSGRSFSGGGGKF